MNTVEIRLTTTARLDEALAVPADAIGIGQEGCLTKLPGAAELRAAADRVRTAGRAFVLIAPIAWPRTAETLLERLFTVAADGPVTIAVNDVGTALALAGARPPGCTLVAGLGLTRAPASSGDAGDPAPLPMVDTATFDLLAGLGVTGVELDPDTPAGAAGDRWEVRQLAGTVPLGYGRSCPTARHHRTGPPDCRPLCDTSFTIAANQRWRLVHGHREPVPAGTARPLLTVWGNAVHRPAGTAPTAPYRIVDARPHTPGALAATVAALRGERPVTAAR